MGTKWRIPSFVLLCGYCSRATFISTASHPDVQTNGDPNVAQLWPVFKQSKHLQNYYRPLVTF